MRLLRRRPKAFDDTSALTEVLAAEKSSAAEIADARKNIDAWLAAERATIETGTANTLQELGDRAVKDEAAARQNAIDAAASTIALANAFSDTLTAVDDAALAAIVARHVALIVPGPEP